VEEALPFDKPSGLDQPDLALRMHLASSGYVGRYMNLVQAASERAIDDGLTFIGPKLLATTFRAIEGVADDENPFFMAAPEPDTYSVVRGRVRARKATAAARAVPGSSRSRPDFRK
jgi:hypothetical protein